MGLVNRRDTVLRQASPRPKKLERANPEWAMLNVFFDVRRVVTTNLHLRGRQWMVFLPRSAKQTEKRINRMENWKLHQDNASSPLQDDQTQKGVAKIPSPPTIPTSASAELFLLPKIKSSPEEHHHKTLRAVKKACTRVPSFLRTFRKALSSNEKATDESVSTLKKCNLTNLKFCSNILNKSFFRNFSWYFLYKTCMINYLQNNNLFKELMFSQNNFSRASE